jgi:metal-responsive CopG/Arc/MetJ family transcriptional regulator
MLYNAMPGDYTRTTVKLKSDVLKKLKLISTINNIQLSEIINIALEEYLRQHQDEFRYEIIQVVES